MEQGRVTASVHRELPLHALQGASVGGQGLTGQHILSVTTLNKQQVLTFYTSCNSARHSVVCINVSSDSCWKQCNECSCLFTPVLDSLLLFVIIVLSTT